jgi:SAM-dependent methyltransferase
MSRRRTAGPAFDEFYFQRFCDTGHSVPYAREEPWLSYYASIADRIVKDVGPKSVLDAGCAFGMVVEALRDRNVEAFGVDISEYAISNVREDVRQYCWVGSITEPFPRHYDLIVTIETLEHLQPADAERALDNICSHTDEVIFSSTPEDQKEATHLCVRPPEFWAEMFARNGFYRDTQYDASTYLTPWAVRFCRRGEAVPRVVSGYERLLWQLRNEARQLRLAALEGRQEMEAVQQRIAQAEENAAMAKQQTEAAVESVRAAQADVHSMRDSRAYRYATRLRTFTNSMLPLHSRRGRTWHWMLDKIERK